MERVLALQLVLPRGGWLGHVTLATGGYSCERAFRTIARTLSVCGGMTGRVMSAWRVRVEDWQNGSNQISFRAYLEDEETIFKVWESCGSPGQTSREGMLGLHLSVDSGWQSHDVLRDFFGHVLDMRRIVIWDISRSEVLASFDF